MDQKKTELFQAFKKLHTIEEPKIMQEALVEEQREILLLIGNKQLEQTVADIQIVRECLNNHNTITVIAEQMNRTEEYILMIAMNIPANDGEDDIALARRIMME